MEAAELKQIVEKVKDRNGGLISILEEIQSNHGYLPAGALKAVAAETGRSLVDVYGVATFYRAFSLTPKGKHLTSACVGTACHVRGAPAVTKELERQLGIKAGQTTEDREFTLETVNCLGACALGPIVVVDGQYHSNVGRPDLKGIIQEARDGGSAANMAEDDRYFPVEVGCSRCNHSLMDEDYPIDDYPSVRVTVSFGDKHGWLRLSSLYGSHHVESEHTIQPATLVDLFCPHCHAKLAGAMDCPECSAPMVSMIVRGGGMVQICTRHGCEGHVLDVG